MKKLWLYENGYLNRNGYFNRNADLNRLYHEILEFK